MEKLSQSPIKTNAKSLKKNQASITCTESLKQFLNKNAPCALKTENDHIILTTKQASQLHEIFNKSGISSSIEKHYFSSDTLKLNINDFIDLNNIFKYGEQKAAQLAAFFPNSEIIFPAITESGLTLTNCITIQKDLGYNNGKHDKALTARGKLLEAIYQDLQIFDLAGKTKMISPHGTSTINLENVTSVLHKLQENHLKHPDIFPKTSQIKDIKSTTILHESEVHWSLQDALDIKSLPVEQSLDSGQKMQNNFAKFYEELPTNYTPDKAYKKSPFLELTRCRDKKSLLVNNYVEQYEDNFQKSFGITTQEFLNSHSQKPQVRFNLQNFKISLKQYKQFTNSSEMFKQIENIIHSNPELLLQLVMMAMISDPTAKELDKVNNFCQHHQLKCNFNTDQLRAFKNAVIGFYPCIYRKPNSNEIINATQVYAIGLEGPNIGKSESEMTQNEFYQYYYNIFNSQLQMQLSSNKPADIIMTALGDFAFLMGVEDPKTLKNLINKARLTAIKDNLAQIQATKSNVSIMDYGQFFAKECTPENKLLLDNLLQDASITLKSGSTNANIKANTIFFEQAKKDNKIMCLLNAGDSKTETMLAAKTGGYNSGDATLEEWMYLEAGTSAIPFTYLFKKALTMK